MLWEHYFDWKLKDKIIEFQNIRQRNGINARSKLEILRAENGIYIAKTDDKVLFKMGGNNDMGNLTPRSEDGWNIVSFGDGYAVWEKK